MRYFKNFSNPNHPQLVAKTGLSRLLSALKSCTISKDLAKGRILHAEASESGEDSNIYVANSLVNLYAKCGSMTEARYVFGKIPFKDVVSWTSLMMGYVENGEPDYALNVFSDMVKAACEPNSRTFVTAVKACTSLATNEDDALAKGVCIHRQAEKFGLGSDPFLASVLVNMYGKYGSMGEARRAFERVEQPDVVLWNSLLAGYVENGEPELVLELCSRMRGEGCEQDARTFLAELKACASLSAQEDGMHVGEKVVRIKSLERGMAAHSEAVKRGCDSDIFVASSLVDMYSKSGSMLDAHRVFDRMPSHDVVSWTALILGYSDNGEEKLALDLFSRCTLADTLTFVAALTACSNLAVKEAGVEVDGSIVKLDSLVKGFSIHSKAMERGLAGDILLDSTLVDVYAKCRSMEDARKTFDRMKHHTVVSWNALLSGYADNGEGDVTLELYEHHSGLATQPNALTLVAALKACGGVAYLPQGKAVHGDILRSGLENLPVVMNSLVEFYRRCWSIEKYTFKP